MSYLVLLVNRFGGDVISLFFFGGGAPPLRTQIRHILSYTRDFIVAQVPSSTLCNITL